MNISLEVLLSQTVPIGPSWTASLLLAMPLPGLSQATQAPVVKDGVKVDDMSGVRKLVPAETLERQAAQQYMGLKQQAHQQGALVPKDDPQLQRIQNVARKLIPFALRWNPAVASPPVCRSQPS